MNHITLEATATSSNSIKKPLAFITGASSGLGQALALQYHNSGYRLALVGRRTNVLKSWLVTQSISILDDNCVVYGADVGLMAEITMVAERCLATQGVPDVVIGCAGISMGVDTSLAKDVPVFAQILQTNVMGLVHTFQPFVLPMQERGHGVLVGLASVAGIRGLPGHGAYCASKAAAIAYLESLRGELRGKGISVLTISPGYIDTPMTQKNAYSMPFLMPVHHFAEVAFQSIQQRKTHSIIPWQMGWVAKLLRILPNGLFDVLLVGRGKKARKQDE